MNLPNIPFLNPQTNLQNEVEAEAQRRKIKLMILPTTEAIEILKKAEPAEPTPSFT